MQQQRDQDRLERLHQARRRLLHEGRQALLDAVQLVDADLLLQQGRLQEGGARSREAAEDVEGGGGVLRRSSSPPAPPSAASPRAGRRGPWSRTCTPPHDQPFATKNNGFDGRRGRRAPDQPRVRPEAHRRSSPPGRRTTSTRTAAGPAPPDPKFVSGDCAMYIQSSALIGGFTRACKFDWGTGELPHWGAPYKKATSIIGGATLWVLKGKPAGRVPRRGAVPRVPRRSPSSRCGGT